MTDTLSGKVFTGTCWTLLERLCGAVIHFAMTVVLARLLTPDAYGIVAIVSIFVSIAGVFVDSGFASALVQKKHISEHDVSTVFWFNVVISVVLYLILFLTAPAIENFYSIPNLCNVLRVIALSLIFNSIGTIQTTMMNREMRFKLSFRISMVINLASAIVGVGLAIAGAGVWALVGITVMSSAVGMIVKWYWVRVRIRLIFNSDSFYGLFSYGWKIALSSLLDAGFSNLYGLVIGKCYSHRDLSFINRGRQMPQMLMENINGSLGRVAFPALAKKQDSLIAVRDAMRQMIVCSTFFIFPLLTIMAASADNIVLFLFGEQWVPAIPYMRLACFSFALWPFHTINLQGIQAIGRSDVFLKLEILKKVLAVIVLICAIPYGVYAYMFCYAFVLSPISVLINAWPNRKLLMYSVSRQIRDVFPTMACSFAVVAPVLILSRFFARDNIISLTGCLAAQFMIGGVIFCGLACLFRFSALYYIAKISLPYVRERSARLAGVVDCLMKRCGE